MFSSRRAEKSERDYLSLDFFFNTFDARWEDELFHFKATVGSRVQLSIAII
ncbi:putative esterase/lipase/thioesterase [Calderihabitans maritimus]|uniref:Putative esterase/lipase/thioesterase n=1 Tax=Calderihabitans maritimus TaxID=1246530 RepID=A0A1Z5HQW1_9FIRM|nr:putative esterase/lipase/thioesterase [Calderihabitans maritimus]